MISSLSSNKSLSILALFTASWWVFGPKISIIAVPGYEQGIRLEDILFAVLFGILGFETLSRRGQFEILGGKQGFALISFMFASVLCSVLIYQSSIYALLFSVRWLEYLLMGSILFQVALLHRRRVLKLFKYYIVLNACIAPFSALSDERYAGLSAGPWEVSTVIILCFISVKPIFKSQKELYFYALCVLLVILSAQARIQLLAYLALLVFYKETRYKLVAIALPGIIYLLFSGALDGVLKMVRFDSIDLSSIGEVFHAIRENGSDADFYTLTDSLPESDASTIARLLIWSSFIYKWLEFGGFAILFGIGPGVGGVVVDGLYIRLLTEFGLFGTLIFIIFIKKLMARVDPEYRIQLVLIIGIISLTNDPITSQRIFSAICLSVGLLFASNGGRILNRNKQVEVFHAEVTRV